MTTDLAVNRLALTIALCLLATPALADVTGPARVIDGDTLEVQGQRIRLHGIDAPESRQLCRLDGEPWQCGKDAANALVDKIARRPVTCEDLGRDTYDRIIGRCAVAGEDIESWMVSQGWALAYRRYSLDYVDEEADAQAARYLGQRVREAVGVAPGEAARLRGKIAMQTAGSGPDSPSTTILATQPMAAGGYPGNLGQNPHQDGIGRAVCS